MSGKDRRSEKSIETIPTEPFLRGRYDVPHQYAGSMSSVSLSVQEKRAFSSIMIRARYFMSFYIIFGVSVWLPKLMLNAGFTWGSSLSFRMTVNLAGAMSSNLGGMLAFRIGAKKTAMILFVLAFCALSLIGASTNFYIATIIVFIGSFGFIGGQNVLMGMPQPFIRRQSVQPRWDSASRQDGLAAYWIRQWSAF